MTEGNWLRPAAGIGLADSAEGIAVSVARPALRCAGWPAAAAEVANAE
jgi:hypothetical protein